MRLFTAVDFTPEIKDKLYGIINQMKPRTERANFTRKENLHLTLVFIGEKNQAEYNDIVRRLSGVKFEPFKIEFENHGRFRNIHWIGIKHSDKLAELQKRIADTLEIKADFDYTPHITLAREVIPKNDFKLEVPTMEMKVDRFNLMKSERINGILKYTAVTSHQASAQTPAGNC
jgi:2''-5'' RNA ligase